MLHTKLIGRIAFAASIIIFSGMNLTANAVPEIANTPLINFPGTQSSNPTLPGRAVVTNSKFFTVSSVQFCRQILNR